MYRTRAGTRAGLLGLVSTPVSAGALEIQGHRGARGLAPENTLEGFRTALAIGVHTLELDVGMTRDGVVVVHHDATLNPDTTRDAQGNWIPLQPLTALTELTFAELQALDVGAIRPGSDYARRFPSQSGVPGARIPTLTDVAAMLRDMDATATRLNVEVKIEPEKPALTAAPEVLADAVIEVLGETDMTGRASIQSFDWRIPARVQHVAPGIPTGYLSSQRPWWNTLSAQEGKPSAWTAGLRLDDHGGSVPDLIHAAGGDVWLPDHRDLDAVSLARARATGLRVAVWTVNAPDDIRRALDLGVDGIISDYPDRVREAAAAMGHELPAAR